MNRLAPLALILTLALSGAAAVMAQEGTDPGDTPPTLVTVDVGDYTYSLEASEPLSACAQETRVDFEGVYATVIVFARHLDGTIYPLGTYSTRATAGLEGVEVGNCVELEARE